MSAYQKMFLLEINALDFPVKGSFPSFAMEKSSCTEGKFMNHIFKTIVRYAIFLALTGEITSCTLELREKAGKSMQTGLISLKSLNDSLHRNRK